MKNLGLNEIRELFLSFYQSKEHFRRGSFPLIPQDDKSLLIINSGMAPMKPYFAGIKEPPSRRMTTCQKCIRTADIENVGFTSRHGTFFEMLGSFSFGDYFKKESISWGWEFITEVLEMPTDRLWATVYEKDDEAYAIWRDIIGMPEEKIVRLGKDDNFWEIGSGPCGPCSEIYFDRGEKYSCGKADCKPGCDCDRYVEFWNHVFTQFDNDGNDNYTELVQKNIDTGMGLERLACILQGVESIFDVDTISHVLRKAEEITGVKYADGALPSDVSLRIITDHVRSATFMIGDKITPGNEGRGYVLRRLIRRAARHGRKLGVQKPFMSDLVDVVVATCGDGYPELVSQQVFIKKIVAGEEEKFMHTLDQGEAIMDEYAAEMERAGETVLSGDKAFKLHDTYGFPIDITEEIMGEKGYTVDREGFEAAMARQKQAGKDDAAEKDFAWEDDGLADLMTGETLFTGYNDSTGKAHVLAIFTESGKFEELAVGSVGNVILDTTPFYATGGGQEADLGTLSAEDGLVAKVLEVSKNQKTYIHKVQVESGTIKVGGQVTCDVDEIHRNNSARNHTATHLLQKALQDELGTHVEQAGSQVTSEGLRFDFTHFEAMTPEQLQKVETAVNDHIDLFMPVTAQEKPLAEAKAEGVMGLFEDKYGDVVRVVSAGDYSKELCGGIHVHNTGQIGAFKIMAETGVASGVRRIEAITGRGLLEQSKAESAMIKEAAAHMKATPDMMLEKVERLLAENKQLKKEAKELKLTAMNEGSGDLFAQGEEINGVHVLCKKFEGLGVNDLRAISDQLKSEHDNLIMVLASVEEGKVTFIVSLTDDAVSKGYHAGNIVKQAAQIAGGGGGGKANMAQAGGKLPEKTEEALEKAKEVIAAGA